MSMDKSRSNSNNTASTVASSACSWFGHIEHALVTRAADQQRTVIGQLFRSSHVIGFCFVASWSPTCRSFARILKNFYDALLRQQSSTNSATSTCQQQQKECELIVFCVDSEKEAYLSIVREFAGWIVPYESSGITLRVRRAFRVRAVPSLVLVDAATKRIITKDGRTALYEDPCGSAFPWCTPNAQDALRGKLINNKGSAFEFSDLGESIKALYFGANWCPPCKYFTQRLVQVYQHLVARGEAFDVIFCSLDRSAESSKQMFSQMPFFAIPYADPRAALLARIHGVQDIPALVILDIDNEVITKRGRLAITAEPQPEMNFPWFLAPFYELTECNVGRLKDEISVILFTENTEDDRRFIETDLQQVAEEHFENSDDQELTFFFAVEGPFVDQLLEELGLGDAPLPLVCVLDSITESLYVCEDETMSADILRRFLKDFLSGNISAPPRSLQLARFASESAAVPSPGTPS